jgi:hypothetical protein
VAGAAVVTAEKWQEATEASTMLPRVIRLDARLAIVPYNKHFCARTLTVPNFTVLCPLIVDTNVTRIRKVIRDLDLW